MSAYWKRLLLFVFQTISVITLCDNEDGRQQTCTKETAVEDQDIIEATCSEDSGGVAALAAGRWRRSPVPR